MFNILAAVVTGSLFFAPAFADNHTQNDACERIRSAYSADYAKLNTSCANLDNCQNLRAKCPQPVDELASCEVFNTCIEEQFPANATRTSKCVYEWINSPNDGGSCENRNRSIDIVSKRCPGLALYLDPYQDKNYNCDGHKGRYWSDHGVFQASKRAYEEAMANGTCPRVPLPDTRSCAPAFRSVVITDTVRGNTAEIHNGPLGSDGRLESIFDFQEQFENYRLPAGESAANHGAGSR